MKSSYGINQYGDLIKSLILINKPINIIEIGVLDGFSTLIIASTIKKLKSKSKFDAYDLFENYEFNSSKYEDVLFLIRKFKLLNNVNLMNGDFLNIYKNYKKDSIDFAHIDISNNGDTINFFFKYYDKIMREGSIILFEGGSFLRDDVQWMKQYKKKKINNVLNNNKIINEKYSFITIDKYPSMTILYKKLSKKNIRKDILFEFKLDTSTKFADIKLKDFKSRYIDD